MKNNTPVIEIIENIVDAERRSHHPRAVMERVRAALNGLTMADDGIDGASLYLYGEGWNFGEVANNSLFVQATQGQLDGTGIGSFLCRSEERRVGKECRSRWSPYH